MGVTFDNAENKFVFDFEHDTEDKPLQIRRAVDTADKQINLYHYDLVIFPIFIGSISQNFVILMRF